MSTILILSILLSPNLLQDDKKGGRLQEFEAPLKKKKKKKGKQDEYHHQDRKKDPWEREHHHDHEESAFGEFLAIIFAPVLEPLVTYPFIDHGQRFDTYPYDHHEDTYFLTKGESPKGFALEFDLYTVRVEHDLWGTGFTGSARLQSGGEFVYDVIQYREKVGSDTDRLTLNKFMFNYGPGVGFGNVHWSLGWGFSFLDGVNNYSALSLGTAVEWFPMDPISFRVQGETLFFSNATLFDLRAEGRIHWNRFSLDLGIRSLITSGGTDLTGPSIGLSVWF